MGILELRFALFGPAVFKYEDTTESIITSNPTLMDPLDRSNVYVGLSTVGPDSGEGLFARRDIMPGEVAVMYAGVKVYDEDAMFLANMSICEREDAHKNLLNFNDDYTLDVPPEYSDIVSYRATLGHKVRVTYINMMIPLKS
jgi:hypothetical protein